MADVMEIGDASAFIWAGKMAKELSADRENYIAFAYGALAICKHFDCKFANSPTIAKDGLNMLGVIDIYDLGVEMDFIPSDAHILVFGRAKRAGNKMAHNVELIGYCTRKEFFANAIPAGMGKLGPKMRMNDIDLHPISELEEGISTGFIPQRIKDEDEPWYHR